MKYAFSIALFLSCIVSNAQTSFNLNLHHTWDSLEFGYFSYFENVDTDSVQISRLQYYISGIEVVHDGGMTTKFDSVFVLADANNLTYPLGDYNIDSVDTFRFNLGVLPEFNHLDPSIWPSGHPLELKFPDMHWGWASGYRFLVLNGRILDNANPVIWELHNLGDQWLQTIEIPTHGYRDTSGIGIHLNVNVAGWLRDINLRSVGILHDETATNGQVLTNSLTYSVFSEHIYVPTTTVKEKIIDKDVSIGYDYSIPYAPTIYYNLGISENANLEIINMQGQLVFSKENLNPKGNVFINKELRAGTFIVRFVNEEGPIANSRMMIFK